MHTHRRPERGFTLIELSIVIVVIGLLIGGVLVGQNLINAAAVQSQITQIVKYNTAANAFASKYGYLPGDIKDPYATNFGFSPRGTNAGEGDGNGVIEGIWQTTPNSNSGFFIANGENAMFWVDLTVAGLIQDSFTMAATQNLIQTPNGSITPKTSPSIDAYLPKAKLGGGNYIYIWSSSNINYFTFSLIYGLNVGQIFSGPELSVLQAYQIDQKMDDGLPQSGNVMAWYVNYNSNWANYSWIGATGTAATPGSSSTCYDNSATNTGTPGVAGAAQHYSMEISNGNNINCALSFKMQTAN